MYVCCIYDILLTIGSVEATEREGGCLHAAGQRPGGGRNISAG